MECEPDPSSRTHAARADDPYLLYLVQFGALQKFGVGNDPRVLEHLRSGARLRQVLAGRHAEVVAAERLLKQSHRPASWELTHLEMPNSFGRGTEVVMSTTNIDLRDVLSNGEDVRRRFGRLGAR